MDIFKADSDQFHVALIYPPFGPAVLPSLGLALLSAGIKQRGYGCRTFYWNLEIAANLPGVELDQKLDSYLFLGHRPLMPLNEWLFSHILYKDREDATPMANRLLREARERMPYFSTNDFFALKERSRDMVEEMADRLAPFSIIGINSTFFQNIPALALAKIVKKRWPEKTVVLGGANCDGDMGATLLGQYSFVDHVFTGEVDHSFPEFVARKATNAPVNDLAGIVYREDGKVKKGIPAMPIKDLDNLPIPDFEDFIADREKIGMNEYRPLCLPLESSRGCWWGAKQHCTFCGLNALGMGYRQKSQKRFESEVEEIVDRHGVNYLFMADNILSMDYFDQFMDWGIRQKKKLNLFYEIKVNLNRDHVQRLADSGITYVQPGIESLSTKILKLMNKGTTASQNVAFLKYAREHGISVAWNILAGFPGEDPGEYAEMALQLPRLSHLQPPSIVTPIEYHRFSPYHNQPEKYGIQLKPAPRYRLIYPFPEETLQKMVYLFEREDQDTLNFDYILPIATNLASWRDQFRPETSTLTWKTDGETVLIQDRRAHRGHHVYRLKRYAVELFHDLDRPRSLSWLTRKARSLATVETKIPHNAPVKSTIEHGEKIIDFSSDDFAARPEEWLQVFDRAELVYLDESRFLALPVADPMAPLSEGWDRIGL